MGDGSGEGGCWTWGSIVGSWPVLTRWIEPIVSLSTTLVTPAPTWRSSALVALLDVADVPRQLHRAVLHRDIDVELTQAGVLPQLLGNTVGQLLVVQDGRCRRLSFVKA